MSNLFSSLRKYWRAIGIFAGVAIIAFGVFTDLYGTGNISLNIAIIVGLVVFVLFSLLEIIKAYQKSDNQKSSGRSLINVSGHNNKFTNTTIQHNIVKAEDDGKVAGRDIIETHHYYNQQNTGTERTIQVSLGIEPNDKTIAGEPYIIAVITNNEKAKIFCRTEIHGIYDQAGKNILRDISQFANHFSWSGGKASDDGMRAIEAGLDGTVNIAVIHHGRLNFDWLFHEDPNRNWQLPGVYKLNLAVQGTITGNEFAGKNLIIEFEYVENIELDGQGGFSNKGQLKLLNWKTENTNETWLVS